jgi:hypothetical protein
MPNKLIPFAALIHRIKHIKKASGITVISVLVPFSKGLLCGIALTLAGLFGLNKAKAQTPTDAIEFIEYPFVSPIELGESKNYYGSGDVDNNGIVNQADGNRLEELIEGSPEKDVREPKRADVNWDGVVNSEDKTILQNYVDGKIPYLMGYWSKLQTDEEKRDLVQRFLNIANPQIICDKPHPGYTCDCNNFSEQPFIWTNELSKKDLQRFLEFYPYYDTLDMGLYPIPLQKLMTLDYSPNGTLFGGHAANVIVGGEDALDWNDLIKIEPQGNAIIEIGEWYLGTVTNNSLVRIRGAPTINEPIVGDTPLAHYFGFTIKDKIPSEGIYLYGQNPTPGRLPAVITKDNNTPLITEKSPVQGATYLTTPNLNVIVESPSIFDMFKWKDDIEGGEKIYYNKNIKASLDSGKTWVSLFKNTNRNIEEVFRSNPKYENGIGTGEKDLWIKAKNMQGNETLLKTQFRIGPTGLEDKLSNLKYWMSFNQDTKTARLHYIENIKTTHSIFNSAGGLVKTIQDNDGNGETDIDLSQYPDGVYFDRLIEESGKVSVEKVAKR